MLQPKTHFEQVPLEIIKEIVEKQVELEIAIEQVPATRKKRLQKRPSRAGSAQLSGGR